VEPLLFDVNSWAPPAAQECEHAGLTCIWLAILSWKFLVWLVPVIGGGVWWVVSLPHRIGNEIGKGREAAQQRPLNAPAGTSAPTIAEALAKNGTQPKGAQSPDVAAVEPEASR
jgi:hypothetical protein